MKRSRHHPASRFLYAPLIVTCLTPMFLLGAGRAQEQATISSHEVATICYPPFWDAVVPGITRDRHMRRLYGEGLFSREGGHAGSRYFVSKDSSYTVRIEIGVDEVIESVTILAKVKLPKGVVPSKATSPFLPNIPEVYKIRLGFTKAHVHELLGNPSHASTADTWIYQTDYKPTDCYPDAEATFEFADGQVVRMSVSNSE